MSNLTDCQSGGLFHILMLKQLHALTHTGTDTITCTCTLNHILVCALRRTCFIIVSDGTADVVDVVST